MMVMVVMVRFNIGRWNIKIIVHHMMICTAVIVMHVVIQSYRRRCHVVVDVSELFVGGKISESVYKDVEWIRIVFFVSRYLDVRHNL